MEQKKSFELTSFHLHIIAMAAMLLDHLWITLVPGNGWMTDIGRIAFPIFAFMTVEGFFNTKNLKKYVKRLFAFALISEVPFNLVAGGSVFYPVHQNVLWTFLIGIMLMQMNEKVKNKSVAVRLATGAGTAALGFILGLVTFTDYNHAGVLTVLVFYFFRGKSWKHFAAQFV
ncbi:MAG: conjugal transfer protein TraX, partial [Oscillospiraceae bacterium]|nr:conjugal transfer protein TraX [Oscillospiraceae bacterium]